MVFLGRHLRIVSCSLLSLAPHMGHQLMMDTWLTPRLVLSIRILLFPSTKFCTLFPHMHNSFYSLGVGEYTSAFGHLALLFLQCCSPVLYSCTPFPMSHNLFSYNLSTINLANSKWVSVWGYSIVLMQKFIFI